MQPYTYYLFHKPTGKHYYGVRTAKNCHPDELWKTYFSTSKVVKSLREQYGDESFDYEVRKLFETPKDALEWETKFLTRIDAAAKDDWLNQHNSGGKFTTAGKGSWITGKTHNEKTRRKISEKRKLYVGEKHPMYGRNHSEESKRKMAENRKRLFGEDNPFYGKKHSDEVKKYMSQLKKGENNPFYGKKHSDEVKKYISELTTGRPSTLKGIPLSDEHKQKLSHIRKNKPNVVCPYCNKEGKPSGMKRYHFDNCKLKPTS